MAWPHGLNLHYKTLAAHARDEGDAMSSQTHSALFPGSGICLNHTHALPEKNVLGRASRHKPHYGSVKCEVSTGAGAVPGWC